jgi:hypothetical protein
MRKIPLQRLMIFFAPLYLAGRGLARQRYIVLHLQQAMRQKHSSHAKKGYPNRFGSVIRNATLRNARARTIKETK